MDLSGRIAFANMDSFADFLQKNIEKTADSLNIFGDRFLSLKNKLDEIAGKNGDQLRVEDGDVEEDPVILDDFTASIVNEKRELMIEGKVVRYTEIGTIVYHEDFTETVDLLIPSIDTIQLEKIYSEHDFEEDPFYELEPGIFLFGLTELPQSNSKSHNFEINQVNAAMIPWNSDPFNFPFCNRSSNKHFVNYSSPHWTGGIRETAYIYFESNRRMKAKAWSTNYATHSTSGYFTKLQRRRLGAWWASDADLISVSVRGNFYYPHPSDYTKIYIPFKLDPAQGNGYITEPNNNEAKISFGFFTAQIGISNNLQSLLNSAQFCDPNQDFKDNLNSYYGSTNKYCKPKWKPSNAVKIKESESCHFVKRGQYEGEIQVKIKFDD